MGRLVSDHAIAGQPLVLTYTPASNTTAVLKAAQASCKVSITAVSAELTIDGLQGGPLREKVELSAGSGDRIILNIPSEGIVSSGIDVPIVLTCPNLGVGIAGWMVCDDVSG